MQPRMQVIPTGDFKHSSGCTYQKQHLTTMWGYGTQVMPSLHGNYCMA